MKKLLLLLGLTGVLLNAQEKKVGINTNNPQSTLHVNGNMNIRKLGAYTNDSSPISWNPTTLNFAEGKPNNNMKIITFYMKGTKDNASQIYGDLNTGVDASKYTVLITDWQFDNTRNLPTNYDTRVGIAHVKWGRNSLNPLPIIDAYVNDDGYWHIKANYACTETDASYGPYYWNIETMILPKSFSDHIDVNSSVSLNPNQNYDPTGEAESNPLAQFNVEDNTTTVENLNYVASNGNVGINTKDPQATLEVNGKLALANVEKPSENIVFLGRNNTTGEIIPSLVNDKKPIYELVFYTPTDITATNNNDRDRVQFYDTRIPKDKFYIIINTAYLSEANNYIPKVGITHETTGGLNYNPSKLAVLTDVKPDGTISDTWGFRLDYINAGPSLQYQKDNPGVRPVWVVEVLVISKKFMEDISDLNLEDGHSKEYIMGADGNAINSNYNTKGLPEVKQN